MQPISVQVGPLAASVANAISLSQTPAAGALLLNGSLVNAAGVAILDKPRTLLFTSAGNNSTSFFTITGTDWAGSPISEVLQGANIGTKTSLLSYATVVSIVSSAASAAGLTVGTGTSASSPWVRLDSWASPQTLLQNNAFGTVNYTVQQTNDDPNDPTSPVAPANMTWFNSTDPALIAATASTQSNYAYAPVFARVVLNSGSGYVVTRFNQSSDANL